MQSGSGFFFCVHVQDYLKCIVIYWYAREYFFWCTSGIVYRRKDFKGQLHSVKKQKKKYALRFPTMHFLWNTRNANKRNFSMVFFVYYYYCCTILQSIRSVSCWEKDRIQKKGNVNSSLLYKFSFFLCGACYIYEKAHAVSSKSINCFLEAKEKMKKRHTGFTQHFFFSVCLFLYPNNRCFGAGAWHFIFAYTQPYEWRMRKSKSHRKCCVISPTHIAWYCMHVQDWRRYKKKV